MHQISLRPFLIPLLLVAFSPTDVTAQSYGLDVLTPIGKFLNGALPSTTPGQGGAPEAPAQLSTTGVFSNLSTLTPRPGLIHYDVNSPLWTDGAVKQRWIAIPNDGVADSAAEKIGFSQTSPWTFPRGTVLIKQFDLPVNDSNPSVTRRLETRFLVHGDDGVWYGITYRWRADGSEADLLSDGESESVSIATAGGGTRTQLWSYPSRSDCRSCHNANAGHVLGPRTHQLNRDLLYVATGRTDNQLRTLNHLGLFTPAISEGSIGSMIKTVAISDTAASLETRVRSYLDANCSHCHQPGNLAVAFDARFTTAPNSQNLINGPVLYDLGVADARVISPQSLERSILFHRISVTGMHQMPPVGRNTVDSAAVAVIQSWIQSLPIDNGGTGNRAPVAYADETSTLAGQFVDVDVLANDADADGDALSIASLSGAVHGTATIVSGRVRFAPTSGFTGAASFNYTAQDSSGAQSSLATVTVVVLSATSANQAAFVDNSSRLSAPSWTSGVAMGVADMNADGRDDIVHMSNGYDLRIDYQPSDSGVFTFKDLGTVSTQRQWAVAIGDADNNGFPDIITGGYYDGLQYFRASSGATTYTKSVLASPAIFSQAVAFADINNDGWLDIFACHDDAESAKFRNNKSGSFVADSTLIDTRTTPTSDNSGNYGVVWTDYDNDGDQDMYLSKCRAGVNSATDPRRINKLMRNNGNGNFTDVGAVLGLAFGEQSWAADFGDVDNDGDLDVFVGNHGSSSYLMRNNGSGAFTNVTAASGISVTWRVIQNVFRDFNNDGWVDLLLTGEQQQLWLNDRDGTFTLASNPFTTLAMESCAVGDLNKDGFTDIYAGYANLYNTPNASRPDKLFMTVPNGNAFYSISLRGRSSNRTGTGARIELHGTWGTQVREVRSGESYGITHSPTQIFGMGNAASASLLKVRWPSGTVDQAANVPANRFVTLVEGGTVAPTLANPGPQTDLVGNAVNLAITASDSTSDPLTFSAVNLPIGLQIHASTGVISGTIQSGTQGSYPVTVLVTDGWSSVSQAFTWTVTAPLTASLSTSSTSVSGIFTVNVTLSQPVADLSAAAFTLNNASIIGISGSGTQWVLTVQSSAQGAVGVGFGSSSIAVYNDLPVPVNARIQFQPAATPLISGSLADHGHVFGPRFGQKYGWSTDHTAEARRRSVATDPRLDSMIAMKPSANWEMETPNGSYDVTVSVGDASEPSVNTLFVEGTAVMSNVKLRAGKSSSQTTRVAVVDGKITITNGAFTRLQSVQIIPVGSALLAANQGLTGTYYYGTNFNQARFSRSDAVIDFDWGSTSPDPRVPIDQFSVRWTGTMIPRFSEAHTFTTTTAGQVRLWVNGALVIDQWTKHLETQFSGSAVLTAGVPVSIRMDYASSFGAAEVRLEWSSVSVSRRVVPSTHLRVSESASPTTFIGSASGNSDSDYATDLLEHALGTSAVSGVQTAAPFLLETSGTSAVDAVVHRPTAVSDITYSLETTTDLVSWSPVASAPTATDIGGGTTALRWANIHLAAPAGIQGGIIRCRVTWSGGGTAVTTPKSWQRYSQAAGTQTFGINVVRPPVYAGMVGNAIGTNVDFVEDSNLAAIIDPETSYYLEVRSGALAGTRYEIAGFTRMGVSTASPVGTITGARLVVRPHMTIGQVFNKDAFVGSLNPSTADTILFYEGTSFRSLFFVKGGTSFDHWTLGGDVNVANAERTVIQPGVGLMTRITGSQSRTLLLTGEVRTEPFRRQMVTGTSLVSNPWPVDMTPASGVFTEANGFTSSRSPATADQIRLFGGDSGPTNNYVSYWLVGAGSIRNWAALSDVNLTSVNSTLSLKSGRAFFIKFQPTSTVNPWLIPLPGTSGSGLAAQ